jgi:hypothetical protein
LADVGFNSGDTLRLALCLVSVVLLLLAIGHYAYHALVFTEQLVRIAAGAY